MVDREPPSQADSAFWVSRSRPGVRQKYFAALLAAALLIAALAAGPFAQIPLPGSGPLVAAYATAVLVNDLITAVLLFSLFSVTAAGGILCLATGYLVAALTVVPWVLTFPDALAPQGMLDAGLQGTAAIAAVRRLAWPCFVIAYLALDTRPGGAPVRRTGPAIVASVAVAVVAVFALGLFILVAGGTLPALMTSPRQVSPNWQYVPHAGVCLYAVALCLLWRRGRSVLDLWLAVAVATLLVELVMLSYVSGGLRLVVGWWAGRLFGLVSASVVLFVLLAEMTTLYGRLARATASERRAREARLTTMEALSASIAHEVNQPLASMVTNADAGLRWLQRERPDFDEATAALRRIVREGHRAGHIVTAIRSIFRKGAETRNPVDVNEVVAEVAREMQRDAQLAGATLEIALDTSLPVVSANRFQLEQVLANLVTNALEAMSRIERRRVVRVTTSRDASGQILVAVTDTGPGIDDDANIFDAFVTGKPDGLGMGLMLCRSIVEAHGGRIHAKTGIAGGAVFTFTLPADGESRRETRAP